MSIHYIHYCLTSKFSQVPYTPYLIPSIHTCTQIHKHTAVTNPYSEQLKLGSRAIQHCTYSAQAKVHSTRQPPSPKQLHDPSPHDDCARVEPLRVVAMVNRHFRDPSLYCNGGEIGSSKIGRAGVGEGGGYILRGGGGVRDALDLIG